MKDNIIKLIDNKEIKMAVQRYELQRLQRYIILLLLNSSVKNIFCLDPWPQVTLESIYVREELILFKIICRLSVLLKLISF